jgi:phosphotransferase system enzyme I (PtsI)
VSTRRVTIGSSVGLHARPASLFSKAAAAAPVKVTITLANDIDPVDAGSVLMVMGLGAAHGDEVIIEADGPEAEEALDSLAAMLASDLDAPDAGEAPPAPVAPHATNVPAMPPTAAPSTAAKLPEGALRGVGVGRRPAVGPVAHLADPPQLPGRDPWAQGDPVAEQQKVIAALAAVQKDLAARAERAIGEAKAVLSAGAGMAADTALRDAVERATKAGSSGPFALHTAVADISKRLAAAGGYLAERVTDLRDVRDRATALLLDVPMPGLPDPGHPYVLIARDLAPADTADLDPNVVLGLITEEGGPTSHTAILARAMGIPAVVGCKGIRALVEGTEVIVDPRAGFVLPNPSPEQAAKAREDATAKRVAIAGEGPAATKDGHRVAVLVNIGRLDGVEAAAAVAAEGVGLMRTEFLYLDREHAPTVDEQTEMYTRVLTAFAGRTVVVRTLDAGADKPLPFVGHGKEENPALGVRGMRVSREQPDLLDDQLQALARAKEGIDVRLKVMAPMVATPEEAEWFVERVHAAGLTTAGAMVEVPSAALRAPHILEHAAFLSIGTNDLSQYTMAADRLSGSLATLLDPWQPAVLQLVGMAAKAGQDAGAEVGVCGEAAGDPLLAKVLTGLGVTSLSMAPALVDEVRDMLASHTLAQCQEAAARVLEARSPEEARAAAEG